ncbi:Eco57I restriction-modification methylase domain-containing protein [Chloroflexus sp. MS-G]|uniref:Eco57I restriction-modification methylase domain-containing protein n=1 Tax=Chloroflexus sp. MS-G TaxID=1521187 RepID=UPI00068D64FA|nr:type IIL restriction-modification enzyme MmeI [Chloroflexus sp. MS-G]
MSTFPTLRIAGGLFGPDLPEQLLRGELPYQQPEDFGISSRRHLNDEIAAVFHDACTLWGVFQNRLARLDERDSATSLTRDAWMIPLLSMLGYELRYNARAYDIDGMSFAISHRLGEDDDAVPVHIVGFRQELDQLAPGGRPRLAPHTLLQEYLNRTEHLWGLVTNGRIIRLLRNSTAIRRQVYLEFDLATMIEEQHFQDFAVFYRLLHRSRLPRTASAARSCPLEIYYQHALEQGSRVREKLREGVEVCLQRLANGFLAHRDSHALRAWVSANGAADLYRQLLRLVYRLLFLLVSEERGLISADPLYREHYSITRLRTLVERQDAFTDHDDLWCSLRVLWMVLRDDTSLDDGQPLAKLLGLPVLNGELFAEQELDQASITNRDLLGAFWYLTFYDSPPRRINYAALDTEELGSVYESLLELHPTVTGDDQQMRFSLELRGTERRATGSHYTPPELVGRLVQQTLEPVLHERLAGCPTPGERERKTAILTMKILDPACGSGHFLLAAARRLGKELARLRTGADEPPPEAIQDGVRDVITHCIYGVDKNPLAVELCRVALWLEGHTRDKPLTFLESHIRCGDSLIGLADLSLLKDGIPDAAYRPLGKTNRALLSAARKRNGRERKETLFQYGFVSQLLAEIAQAIRRIIAMPETSIAEVRAKRAAFAQLQQSTAFRQLKDACDTYTAAFFGQETDHPLLFTTADLYEVLRRDKLPDPQILSRVTELSHRYTFFHWALEFADILELRDTGAAQGGFDVIIGNPPFMGGLRISSSFGAAYRLWLETVYHPFGGTADLCAAFFRRAFTLLKPGGRLGLIATNTLGQGDTRESGLKFILAQGGQIPFAQRFVKWPGQANVEVNLVVIEAPRLGSDHPRRAAAILDDQQVPFISSRLDDQPEHEPVRLPLNEGKAFQGDIVRGIGFVLESAEAQALIERDPRNADCLFPYLNGEDLNSHPEQQPSRWVICFHDWELARAQQYPDLLRIVAERVKPERERLNGPGDRRNREYWWQFGAYRTGMRQAIAPLRRVLVRSRVSELHAMVFVPQGYIYNEQLIVFAYEDDYHFALLQSAVHEVWVRKQASSLRTDLRYTPTDCFATFPFPPAEYEHLAAGAWQLSDMPPVFWQAAQIGATYHEHRRQIMQARQLGLTKTYNLFHNPTCTDADIVELRRLHVALDRIIMACYGWDDLDPQHDFYPNERGQIRYTVAPSVQRELVWRLMELNR